MRSPAALLASEMVSALRDLTPEGRLEALALATGETILAADHGGGAVSILASYTGRLTDVVRNGRGGTEMAKPSPAVPIKRSPAVPMVDELRAWMSNDPHQKGRLRVVLKQTEEFGAIVILSWIMEGKPIQYASQFFSDGRRAWDTVNREVLKPVGFATVSYDKFVGTHRSPENPRKQASTALKRHQAEQQSPAFPRLPARAEQFVKAVAQLDAEGKSTRDIMAALGISRGAVSRMLAASKGR
ncbi:hypothetical protein [Mesorhizobium sp.]|uniref:hypothetical protein n=1 Tax=Mesorhizobium sp. TaxID=1871066 RepID=UPI000FE4CCA7|nr:hypothetical protein [Mesorhizobium sp.]RWP76884.1 MAG: hypothetical protein EOR10_16590 [Mesorhizobium sp.]